MQMTSPQTRRLFVRATLFIGVLITAGYGTEMLIQFFRTTPDVEIKEILISSISLEFAWATLLLWALFKPFGRRHVLLFTAMAMLSANILHSLNQILFSGSSIGTVTLNLITGILFSSLFVMAFVIASPKSMKS
jgi:hypothetical protein